MRNWLRLLSSNVFQQAFAATGANDTSRILPAQAILRRASGVLSVRLVLASEKIPPARP
jgi:hypothetical protein